MTWKPYAVSLVGCLRLPGFLAPPWLTADVWESRLLRVSAWARCLGSHPISTA